MMATLARIGTLSWRERGLIAEAVMLLAVAAFMIALLPFRRVAALARDPRRAPPRPTEQERRIADVRWAVAACARRVPWRAKCLEQGFTAQWMLRRRAIPAVLHYGVARREGALIAHAWVRAGPIDVIGCENIEQFAEVARFPG